MEIRALHPGDERALEALSPCFDRAAQPAASTRFLESENHHILVAYDDSHPVGFVTGVEMTHPDKGTEMFLYELGVDPAARGHGYGTALVQALAELACDRQCYGMWVLTDADNDAALAAYGAAGGVRESDPVMVSWNLER